MLTRIVACLIVGIVPARLGARGAGAAAPPVQLFTLPQSHASPVLHLLRDARRTIQLEIYLLTSAPIINELQKAAQRGVKVQVLLEQHPFGGSRWATAAFDRLTSAGVQVRWANERAFTYTHEKAVVIDGVETGIFTFNLTSSGLYKNREFGIIDRSPRDARALSAIFSADWARTSPQPTGLGRLVISPINSRRAVTQLIDGARNTLDLYVEEVADSSIETHLESAVRRHVRVRLITSASSTGVDALRAHGVRVALVPVPYIHAKAIVADGARVFVGSENVSSTSLDRNREVGIALSNTSVAQQVESVFSSDWPGAPQQQLRSTPAPRTSPTGSFTVRVSVAPSSLHRGDTLTISARTKIGARCSVRVTYPDGYVSRARALLEVLTVKTNGGVRWEWHMASRQSGVSHVTVRCTLGEAAAAGETEFTILP